MAKSQYYFDQRYLNTDDPWGIFCRPSQMYRLKGYIRAMDKYGSKKADSLLEIACADGYFTEMIADKAQKITAFDYDPILIDLAKKRDLQDHISFKVSSLPDMDGISGHFDMATALEVILYFTDAQKRKIFERVHEMLKRGGHFVFTEDFEGVKGLIDRKKFEIKSVEKEYVNFMHLQDYVYNVARRLNFVMKFLLKYKKDTNYTEFGEKYKHKLVIRLLILLRPLLILILPVMYVLWLLMYIVHSSKLVHFLLILVSKIFRYKMERHTIVIEKL